MGIFTADRNVWEQYCVCPAYIESLLVTELGLQEF